MSNIIIWFLDNYNNPSFWTVNELTVTNAFTLKEYFNKVTYYKNLYKTLNVVENPDNKILKEINLGIIYYNILNSQGFYSDLNATDTPPVDRPIYYLSDYYFSLAIKDNCKYYALNVYYIYYFEPISFVCQYTGETITIDPPLEFIFLFTAPLCINKLPVNSLWSLERIINNSSNLYNNPNQVAYLSENVIPDLFKTFCNCDLKKLIPHHLIPAFYKNYDYKDFFNFNKSFAL